jgi:hypothetical protein
MWLLLYPLVLAALVVWSFYSIGLHFFVLLSMLYLLHYLINIYRTTTPRPWTWLRELTLWDHMHHRQLGYRTWAEGSNWKDYEDSKTVSRLFILEWGTPHAALALLLAAGLHGTQPASVASLRPVIMLPNQLFRLPLLADVCQWLGGVPHCREAFCDILSIPGRSLIMMLPNPLLGASESLDENPYRWLVRLERRHPVAVTALSMQNSALLYRSLGPANFGLFFSCIPRACHLRIAVAQPILSNGPQGNNREDSDVLQAAIARYHDAMNAVLIV